MSRTLSQAYKGAGIESSSSSIPICQYREYSSSTDKAHHGVFYRTHQVFEKRPLITSKIGTSLIHDPIYNKGTGFPYAERDRLKIRGLVPPRCVPMEEQVSRVLLRYNQITDPLRRYDYLHNLQDRNETLFYKILMENIEEMAPVIYTPVVGEACQKFGSQFRRARGMYFSTADRGEMSAMVWNWPAPELDVIVVTDGSRILGLGDLGCHGMGIPIGKLSLYVAGGGIHPARTLPITLDMGTNNEQLLNDPFYLGRTHRRLTGEQYFNLVDEFMNAVYLRWPNVLVQFEDFDNSTAMALLQKYKDKYLCFNDDIQGTGSVTLSGLLCALRAQGKPSKELTKQRIVVLGAGSAGLGVVNSIVKGMVQEGLTREQACKNIYLVDKDGVIGTTRKGMQPGQLEFAKENMKDGALLEEVVRQVKPTILLGLSGVGRTFTKEVIETMAANVDRPIIFPLSNPTSKSECTAREAFEWTKGKCIFASGSPFDPVILEDKVFYPTQGNNMYIFPGVGLGAVVCKASRITDSMFYEAARRLSKMVTDEEVRQGRCYPSVTEIREVSKAIAMEVCRVAFDERLAGIPAPKNDKQLAELVESCMYVPEYVPLISKT